MRCDADILYLKRVLPLFLLVSLMDSFAGSIVRLSAHDEVCNGWTSIDNYTDFFLRVLRALCGEPCISTIQSGSYLAWQLGQMRMILQVSFVNRTNDVWKPSSYPQLGTDVEFFLYFYWNWLWYPFIQHIPPSFLLEKSGCILQPQFGKGQKGEREKKGKRRKINS